jgi:hypothetical protein
MKKQNFIEGSSETTREITRNLDINFYNWWIGFLEGDGSFFIRSNKTLGFEISQKTKDAQILFYIKKNLGFGQVNHNSKIELSRFILSCKKTSYSKFLQLLKIEDLRLIKRQVQYSNWINKAVELDFVDQKWLSTLENVTPKLPSWEDSWFSGFIDAEGCFRINYDKTNDKYQLFFQITQDEIEIIEKIKNLFGKNHRGSIIKDRNTYLLMISSKKARETLIQYLKKYPLKSEKRLKFMKWEKGHRLLLNLNSENKEKTLNQLKELINK